LTNDTHLAEDIVQNVFMSICKNRNKLKEEFVIKSYLYKSVYNEFIDQYRKKKVVLTLEKKQIDALTYIVEE
jgi:DNA-directed RNA polymerase specialized sigma24 family protein